MTPETKTRQSQRKSAAQTLRHRFECRGGISTPVHRQLLSTCCRGAREDERITLTAFILKQIKDGLVIKVCVIVVHLERIGTIVINNICWDAFAKVSFE